MKKEALRKSPVCVYVLWHPDCEQGRDLAKSIYHWFHAPSADLHRAGLGLPVYYRSTAADSTHHKSADSKEFADQHPGMPPSIAIAESSVNIIVPLVDENMVADAGWRAYLGNIANSGTANSDVEIFPVPLHHSAFRLPEPIKLINYLRIDQASPVTVSTSLRRLLTEVVSRKLLSVVQEQTPDSNPPSDPITVFLSHAKRDGQSIAESFRDRIASYGQVKCFYDENDLPVGQPFGDLLLDEAGGATAAMLCVVTDAYAGRPWCRAEIQAARTPRNLNKRNSKETSNQCWSIQPLVAVYALHELTTRGIPELGSAPLIRWRADAVDEILDYLMLELLLFTNHRLRARQIPYKPNRHIITWVPDLPTLMSVKQQVGADNSRHISQIVYPGHGLTPSESAIYSSYFDDDIQLLTFEEANRE